jgi:large subunit ribosomal protein L6
MLVVRYFAIFGKEDIMSRIGLKEVRLPDKVKVVFIENDRILKVSGEKGELTQNLRKGISFDINEGRVLVKRENDSKEKKALHGLYRSLLNNMVIGVSEGFIRKLELNGVGYRAQLKGKDEITFQVGYSHPVYFKLPKGIDCNIDDNTIITLSGYDKQLLGQIAALIRQIRPPEPYKRKGIKYAEETVKQKAGKSTK